MASKETQQSVPTSWAMSADILLAIRKARLQAIAEYNEANASNAGSRFSAAASLAAHTGEFLREVEQTLEAEMHKTSVSSRLPMPDLKEV